MIQGLISERGDEQEGDQMGGMRKDLVYESGRNHPIEGEGSGG